MFAGPYTQAECGGRKAYTVNEEKYDECIFCPASCPSRDLFKEPDSGLPLKCDMCGEPPPPEGPLCVAWCLDDALTYVETEEMEDDEEEKEDEKEIAIDYLVKKYGAQKIRELLDRKSKHSQVKAK
jgi:benzoyl-CoA reductase subunit BamC